MACEIQACASDAQKFPGNIDDEENRSRLEFFATGVENWSSILGDLTFPSEYLTLSREEASALANPLSKHADNDDVIAKRVDAALANLGWSQAFVKLSTRAPKDSPQILDRAKVAFEQQGGTSLPANDRCILFSTLVQENFCMHNGSEAVALLATSERIREDCAWALAAPSFEELCVQIVLRRWDGAIPPASEFRGIAWKGQMHAISQYYHPLHFPELDALRPLIETDLREVFNSLQERLSADGFESCIIDFAWLGKGNVKVIELNPFDGIGLGTMAASTCLFKWDDTEDRKIITEGPFELRCRTSPKSEYDLKKDMNVDWKDIVFPPRWQVGQNGKAKAAPTAALPVPNKGKGKTMHGYQLPSAEVSKTAESQVEGCT